MKSKLSILTLAMALFFGLSTLSFSQSDTTMTHKTKKHKTTMMKDSTKTSKKHHKKMKKTSKEQTPGTK